MFKTTYDVSIVGAGPNGLTAAVILGAAGLSVLVLEAKDTIGGSCRTAALTRTGFTHDICAAIHPMGILSPAFARLRLQDYGLGWVTSPAPLAHPLDDGRVAMLERSVKSTAATLGEDGAAWTRLVEPFLTRHRQLFLEILRPLGVPRHPWLMAEFGRVALQSSNRLVTRHFVDRRARALFSGCAAHSFLSLSAPGSASFGLALALAGHAVDWPCARGGSQQIVDALAARARSQGCEIHTGRPVRTFGDVPTSRAVLFDVTPRQLDTIDGLPLSSGYRRRLRAYRYGAGAFKIDYALAGPIPWRSPACGRAATVHLGGTHDEIARSEDAAANGRVPAAPFVLMAQQSLFDLTRAPSGQHTGWVYCHVPNGCDVDMTDRIERQIERFAPGFRDLILERHVMPPAALEAHNPNLVGGDIGGGSNVLTQFLVRPFARWDPYTTSHPGLYLCSSATPPGGGVHGMCGYWAARSALRRTFQRQLPPDLDVLASPDGEER